MMGIDKGAYAAAKNPTEGQKKAGNYKKGRVNFHGLDLAIETPAGWWRTGTNKDGKSWYVQMPVHYGYVRRTEGADGDPVDVFLGPDLRSQKVWVIDQYDGKKFDEHKVMLGFFHEADALMIYDQSFSDGKGPERRKAVTGMTVEGFKEWLRTGDTKKKLKKWDESKVLRARDGRFFGKPVAPKIEAVRVAVPASIRAEIALAKSIFGGAAHARATVAKAKALAKVVTVDTALEIAESVLAKGVTGCDLRKADSTKKRPEEIASSIEESFASKIAGALSWLRGKASDIAQAANDAAVPAAEFGQKLAQAFKPLDFAYIGGANQALNDNAITGGDDKTIVGTMSARSKLVEAQLKAYKMDLITNLTDGQRETIRSVVEQSAAKGEPPAVIARNLRETIGLTPTQAQHVLNYRSELEALRPGAVLRDLRDKRFDQTVTSALASGIPLKAAQIDKMVDAYQRRYIAYRAMNIARTEAMRAVNSGSQASIRAAIEAGTLDPEEVVKVWVATKDGKTRDTHKAMDGQRVRGFYSMFTSPSGAQLLHPHDPNAPASETVQCRCTVKFEISPQ